MKRIASLTATAIMVATTATAQDLSRLHSRPTPPSRDALARLNLKLAWSTYVPMDGKRDGFFSVQVLEDQILVQTRSGGIVAVNAADGSTMWRAHPGAPYRISQALGYNQKLVLGSRGPRLFGWDRKTGNQVWTFPLTNNLTAAPIADEDRIYLSQPPGHILAYDLPRPDLEKQFAAEMGTDAGDKPRESAGTYSPIAGGGKRLAAISPLSSLGNAIDSTRVEFVPPRPWEYFASTRIEQTPLLVENTLVVAGSDGTFFGLSKVDGALHYLYHSQSVLPSRLGQYEGVAYVAAQDYNVYALDIQRERIIWRFTGSSPILNKPDVSDEDVFLMSVVDGFHRINRQTGDLVWRNKTATRFLSANKKVLYAADRAGRLLILDKARGTQLGTLDTRDFVFPVSNELTDRLYLASNDGLLVCLHDRDYAKPLILKKAPAPPPEKGKGDKGKDKPAAPPVDKAMDKGDAPDK